MIKIQVRFGIFIALPSLNIQTEQGKYWKVLISTNNLLQKQEDLRLELISQKNYGELDPYQITQMSQN